MSEQAYVVNVGHSAQKEIRALDGVLRTRHNSINPLTGNGTATSWLSQARWRNKPVGGSELVIIA